MNENSMDIMTVIEYIEEHLDEKLDLNQISQAVHYSKYYLHRIFTYYVGISIHDYVLRRQMTEAAKLLVGSQRPIIEIAFRSGYDSQQAFSTAFKEMYKVTPNQFRKQEEFYPLQLKYVLNQNKQKRKEKRLSELDITQWKDRITYVEIADKDILMNLVHITISGFPHYKEQNYLTVLEEYIQKHQAYIIKENGMAVGLLGFTRENGNIDFLAVHPLYRKKGIAQALILKMFNDLEVDRISITTFREGDKADPGIRSELQQIGFSEQELLEEYGYPTQKLILSNPLLVEHEYE